MKRVVNGHYADPTSTRNIEDITPDDYGSLIDLIRNTVTGTHQMLERSDAEIKEFIETNAGIELSPEDFLKAKEALQKNSDRLMGFLEVLNQPYPGGVYQDEHGENFIPVPEHEDKNNRPFFKAIRGDA